MPGSAEPVANAPQALAAAVFVPEGFSRAAFFLGPLWLVWHRLWLELLAWLVLFAALASGELRFIAAGTGFLIAVLLELLLGLEANNLRRGGLARAGYRLVDVAAGATRDDAERSFFRRALTPDAAPPQPVRGNPPPPLPQAQVLGSLPLPEDPR